MKKLLRFLTIALVAGACTCQAVDYDNHFYNQRVYRVSLGSGTVPSASDMKGVAIHNGEMVLNTDDDCLYIMHDTNVYTKITSAGTVTLTAMSVPLASNKVYIGDSSGLASEEIISGLFTIDTGAVASATSSGLVWTNGTAAGTLTPLAVTNATVGGGVLSGVTLVVTNASNGAVAGIVTNTATTEITLVVTNGAVGAVGGIVTNTTTTTISLVVTNGANGAVAGIVTNVTSTSSDIFVTNVTYTAIDMVTNVTWTTAIYTNANFTVTNVFTVYYDPVQETVAVNTINALEKGTVLVSITPETGDITPTFTPAYGEAIASVTDETGDITPTFTPAYGTAIASVTDETGDITPTLTLETGTPAVSTPTIALETVTSGAVTVTITPATGTFVKP